MIIIELNIISTYYKRIFSIRDVRNFTFIVTGFFLVASFDKVKQEVIIVSVSFAR